jgi:hypothetical protein
MGKEQGLSLILPAFIIPHRLAAGYSDGRLALPQIRMKGC